MKILLRIVAVVLVVIAALLVYFVIMAARLAPTGEAQTAMRFRG